MLNVHFQINLIIIIREKISKLGKKSLFTICHEMAGDGVSCVGQGVKLRELGAKLFMNWQ